MWSCIICGNFSGNSSVCSNCVNTEEENKDENNE